jgi:hypothetical protein
MKHATLVIASLIACAVPAAAQNMRDTVMEGAGRCYGIADDHAWLDCFYGSAQPMRARLGLSPAPQAQVGLVPPAGAGYLAATPAYRHAAPPVPVAKEKGFFGELLGSTKPAASNMPMAAYSFDKTGRFTIRLQNGQTYQQEENDLSHPGWSGPPESLLVTINASGDKYTVKVKSDPGKIYHARRK